MYSREQFAKMIDNTVLRPDTTRDDILRLVDESATRHMAAVCVFPCCVGTAARALQGTDVKVCTVISFPFGADTRALKNFGVRNAIHNGAQEIDVVMNIGKLKSGDVDGTRRDLAEIIDGIRTGSGSALRSDDSRRVLCKIIIETCYLTDAEKELSSKLVRDSGADFIKTSTGTGSSGATVDDVRLIRRSVGPGSIGIKASGGVRTVEHAVNLLNAGANRIGTSSGAAIFDAYRPDEWSK
jgi:deoxyribose-phosphate aldolase